MTTKSSKSASGDDAPAPTPATLASQTEPETPPRDVQASTSEASADTVTAPLPGEWLRVQALNPDTNAMIDVPALTILAGETAADGSATVDLWAFDLLGVRRATVQLYATRDDALASDRPAGAAAWRPEAPAA